MLSLRGWRGTAGNLIELVWLKQNIIGIIHTRHILPPSEIDLGLFWADLTDLEGKHLFHRIGWKGRIWQVCDILACIREQQRRTVSQSSKILTTF